MKDLQTFLLEQGAVTVRTGGISVSVLDSPQSAFGKEGKDFVDSLVDTLWRITAESFGVELQNKSRDGIYNHVVSVDSLALLHHQNSILGFASSKLFREDGVFYLHGAAVASHFKGKGGSKTLTQTLISRTSLPLIAGTTQNPIVFCLMRTLCTKIYPSPNQRVAPEHLHGLGVRLLHGQRGNFVPESFVVTGLYRNCLYHTIPQCKDSSVNEWFAEALNIQFGQTKDGFLFIGERKL